MKPHGRKLRTGAAKPLWKMPAFAHLDRGCFGKPSVLHPLDNHRLQPRTKAAESASTPFPPILRRSNRRDEFVVFSLCCLLVSLDAISLAGASRQIARRCEDRCRQSARKLPVSEGREPDATRWGLALLSIKFVHLRARMQRACNTYPCEGTQLRELRQTQISSRAYRAMPRMGRGHNPELAQLAHAADITLRSKQEFVVVHSGDGSYEIGRRTVPWSTPSRCEGGS